MFKPKCDPVLIGSFPLKDHLKAIDLIFSYTPKIPVWPQLPHFKSENMILQFLPGMPGFDGTVNLNTDSKNFDNELLDFYQEYLDIKEGKKSITTSRFKMGSEAKGFHVLLDRINNQPGIKAVKGQVTGPFTFAVSLKDANQSSVIYDNQLKDVAVKIISLKAKYQVETLSHLKIPIIIFFDEPGLAGFGSSEFISISRETVMDMLKEAFDETRSDGVLIGVHVCANTDWSLVVDAGPDIINFDAYGYFDKFILFKDKIKDFLDNGGIIAWGIVPTLEPEDIAKESIDSLYERFLGFVKELERGSGTPINNILSQSLITPSCGLGSLKEDQMVKVLDLLKGLSEKIKKEKDLE